MYYKSGRGSRGRQFARNSSNHYTQRRQQYYQNKQNFTQQQEYRGQYRGRYNNNRRQNSTVRTVEYGILPMDTLFFNTLLRACLHRSHTIYNLKRNYNIII